MNKKKLLLGSLFTGGALVLTSLLFAKSVFAGGKLEIWTHRFFLLNGASVVLTTVSVCIDNPLVFNLLSVIV